MKTLTPIKVNDALATSSLAPREGGEGWGEGRLRLLAVLIGSLVLPAGVLAADDSFPLKGEQPAEKQTCKEKTPEGEKAYTCGDSPRGKMLEHSHATPLPASSSSEREGAEFASLPPSALTIAEIKTMLVTVAPVTVPQATVTLSDKAGATHFASGRAELTPEGVRHLEGILANLKGKEKIRFEIVGHTDNQRISARLKPTYPDNQALSQARALTIANWFKDKLGLAADAFSVSGKGESQPVASNGNPEGMAQNRRTEIHVWFQEPAAPLPPPPPPRKEDKLVQSDPCAPVVAGGQPFSISVDGIAINTDTKQVEADRQRCVDVALERADIQVKYDPMNTAPALNVWVPGTGALRGRPVEFSTYSNYAWWVKKAEVRVFARGQQTQETPIAVIPVTVGGSSSWLPAANIPADVGYLLRVYDAKGRFDETALKPLTLLERAEPLSDVEKAEREKLTGWGESSLKLRNIGASGGMVTVSGKNVKAGQTVTALGETVPVDGQGKFAVRQILPAGPHSVEVSVKDAKGQGMSFRRNLNIPDKDWFYVAIADITVGRDHTSGPAPIVTADSQHYNNETWVDGRGAFYLKGKIKGEYLLTASADTGEQPMKSLFSNFQAKDPYYLLRNIDPNRYYPVYGDDSAIVDDAPTQGRFFVKLERGDSHVMWGNFKTSWTGTELTNFSRGLYGADLLWNSEATTSYGEKQSTVNAFVADPGTLQSREDFRGTGGSLYWLHHQDITQGSDRLWVEIRDKDSGLTIERKPLVAAQDYEIDYLQGRITLRAPLPSVADGSSLVQTATANGNPVFLVSTYEYTPGLNAISGNAVGLRASHWFNDHIRLGLTRYHQGDSSYWQDMKGLDATLRYKPGTYMRVEAARSTGPGSESYASLNGGFNFASTNASGQRADARRVDLAADLSELKAGWAGKLSAYHQTQDAGFSGPGQTAISSEATTLKGAAAVLPLGGATEIALKADDRSATSQSAKAGEVALRHKLNPEWGVSAGLRRDQRDNLVANASPTLSQNGYRSDLILRVDYRPLADGEKAKAEQGGSAAATSVAAPVATPGTPGAAQSSLLPAGSLSQAARLQQPFDPAASAGLAAAQMPGLKYKPWNGYGFIQDTLGRSDGRDANNRGGLGLGYQVNDRLRLGAEASGGSGGGGGRLSGDYRVDDRSNYYLAYAMETESADNNYRGRQGALTSGSHYRLSDQVGLFGETRWTNGAGSQSLTHAFGVDLAPNDRWTMGIKMEKGQVSDALAGDLDRRALGLSAAYKFEKIKFASALEVREERSATASAVAGAAYTPGLALNGSDRTVWLMKNSLGYQASPAWRLLGKLNFSRSSNSQGAFYDGDYTEFVAGVAYRPVDNDRWNTLFKYTYFYNLPSPGQVDSTTGSVLDYTQKSQVLDVDTVYDLKPWLSVGGKYGFRWGDLRDAKVGGNWFSSRAELMVLRADLHFVKEWDALLEARRLHAQEASDTRSGFLVAVYRHLGEHAKLGVGYNFTDFSDNLTDLSYRSRGWFVNGMSSF
ncbi:MAG: OmpA family protein [Rhodocyclaceae bacterium]|nr:OmpA family protein [Rhodocyclaceae bacterium]